MKKPYVSHYSRGGLQPIEFIVSNHLNFPQGNIIKYIIRSPFKGHFDIDIQKALDYINFELESHSEHSNYVSIYSMSFFCEQNEVHGYLRETLLQVEEYLIYNDIKYLEMAKLTLSEFSL